MDSEVLIIGGGAAGLACAAELTRMQVDFHLVEARPRFGGRVLTVRSSGHPVELGAEFIHGAPAEILTLMQRFQLPFVDACDSHLLHENGRLVQLPDFFGQLEKLMPRSRKKKDQSVEDFLLAKTVSKKWKTQFRSFVEGFHGADLKIMGTHALASAMQTDEEGLNGSAMFRHLHGCDQVLDGLVQALEPNRLSLNTIVQNIRWKKNDVTVHCASSKTNKSTLFTAKKLVTTLPIGTLKNKIESGGIQWSPQPKSLVAALEAIEMGHVQRLVLHFRQRFWESLQKEKPISFLHSRPQNYFPTWWTQMPLRTPYLVAWQGGRRAEEMMDWTSEQMLSVALITFAKISGRSTSFLRENLLGSYHHNWSTDPFTAGAYSYIRTDGMRQAQKLCEPISKTLYFAGEATCFDSSRGTLHGAIRSGIKAAHLLIKYQQSS